MPRCLCNQCARPLEFAEDQIGTEAECPYCHKTTRLDVDSSPLVRLPANALRQSPFVKKVGARPAPVTVPAGEPEFAGTRPTGANGQPEREREPAVTATVTAAAAPMMVRQDAESPIKAFARKVLDNMERVVVGKRERMQFAVVAFLAEGHILLEDVPGVAKTMLARALAQSIGCDFKRVQCTPDLLPTDITGASVFNPKSTEFEFRAGPLFANLVLADELNRATPRTQSALLEAMAERSVTVDGINYDLVRPFLIIATQNPIDHEGTFPLPEAQLDRFLIRLSLGYPAFQDEARMLERLQFEHPIETLQAVASAEEVIEAQTAVRGIQVHPLVRDYLLRIVAATREHPSVMLGASPRASMALLRAAQALAGVQGYNFVLPDHIKELAPAVLNHRLLIHPEKRLRKVNAWMVVNEILNSVPVPVLSGGKE